MRDVHKQHHVLYKTTCLVTDKFYVGIHSTDDLDDGYMGSGLHLRRSIAKHGEANHICEIIEECSDRETLLRRESEIVNDDLLNNPLCMNIVKGGSGGAQRGDRNSFFGRHHKPETIERIRASMKGENGPCFGRTGNSHPMFGKQHTNEARVKMSQRHLGKSLSKTHVGAIKDGHRRRNEAKHEMQRLIVKMLNDGLTRKEIAETLGCSMNTIYGATSWVKRNPT